MESISSCKKKRKQEQLRNQHTVTIKEIKFRPKIALNDYELKKRYASEFLEQGNKVKVTLRFRGREITHPEQGMIVMDRLKEDLKEESSIESPARHEGRQIQMVLAPKAKTHPKKSKKELAKKEEPSQGGQKAVFSDEPKALLKESKAVDEPVRDDTKAAL